MTKMKIRIKIFAFALFFALPFVGCDDDDEVLNEETTEEIIEEENEVAQERPVTFELIEFVSEDEILVWLADEPISSEEFEAIELESNWQRQEVSEEGDVNGSQFLRSPDADEEGVFTSAEHYGYQWIFNAQILSNDVTFTDNEEGLLTGRLIAKYQQVTYNAGRTVFILISPEGEEYVRISRDLERTSDTPIIPDTWRIAQRVFEEDTTVLLPNPTLNIIAENNGDSFQGPVRF